MFLNITLPSYLYSRFIIGLSASWYIERVRYPRGPIRVGSFRGLGGLKLLLSFNYFLRVLELLLLVSEYYRIEKALKVLNFNTFTIVI